MGGLVGRLFREFAVTLSLAIGVSLVVSLSTTPMMCAMLLRSRHESRHGAGLPAAASGPSTGCSRFYDVHASGGCCAIRASRCAITLATIGVNIYLFVIVPKGFFPQQDAGRIVGNIQAEQDISFQAMRRKMTEFANIVKTDPAVDNAVVFTGGSGNTTNTGRMFIQLKPLEERKVSADQVIARLRGKLGQRPRRHAVPPGRAGPAHRRPHEQRAVPVHAAGLEPRRAERLRAPDAGQAPRPSPSSATSPPTSRTAGCRPRS